MSPQSTQAPPLLNLPVMREKLARLKAAGGHPAAAWNAIERDVRKAPKAYFWYLPYVALMTEDKAIIAQAREQIDFYLYRTDNCGLMTGLQFHHWCYAFPHARWALWFDAMRRAGFYTADEATERAAAFVRIQHRDFFSGMLTKPYPECVDNQGTSLALSCLVTGMLFGDEPGSGAIARAMSEEALPRALSFIGHIDPSGYSGEGSTYQCRIIAMILPLLVEVIERILDKNVFDTPQEPNGACPRDILHMSAHSTMPSGLMLPWDDYGYMLGIKSPLAYLASRTRDPFIMHLLLHCCDWTDNSNAGWGNDDIIWALAFWPEGMEAKSDSTWTPWARKNVGGVLVDPAGTRYLMQMWDSTAPVPLRTHVNPNALVLEADGVPLTADGCLAHNKDAGCNRFDFDDTYRERRGMSFETTSFNYGRCTGGAHNVLLIDGREGLRPEPGFAKQELRHFDENKQILSGDVTGLYQSTESDTRRVWRTSRLVENAFWLVEDLACFHTPHKVTSRWFFRPEATAVEGGLDLHTPEGVRLQMRALLGNGGMSIETVEGYPMGPDKRCCLADAHAEGETVRWLWLLFPQNLRTVVEDCSDWQAWIAPAPALEAPPADTPAKTWALGPDGRPWELTDAPLETSWWYTASFTPPSTSRWWVRLPRGLPATTRLWIGNKEIPLGDNGGRLMLLPVDVPMPTSTDKSQPLRLTLHVPFTIGFDSSRKQNASPNGPVQIVAERPSAPDLASSAWKNDRVQVTLTDGQTFDVAHTLMPLP